MIRSEIGRCLNALGIVKKEQCHCEITMKIKKAKQTSKLFFSYPLLFFLHEPLCMSSHDAAPDHLWSYGLNKTPKLLNKLKAGKNSRLPYGKRG
jgi:hypothetical protein